MRLLLIEDDELLGDAVKTGLIQLGYVVDWLKDGKAVMNTLKTETFDVILLDLGLPQLSGQQLLKNLRQDNDTTPVLILTAKDTLEDKIKSLDDGADDYLTKPFDLNELSARIRALIRRNKGRAHSVIEYQNIILDPIAHTITLNQKSITTQRREFALLQKLLEHQGQVLSRDQLMQSLYGWNDAIDSNTLEVHIHNLRKKLNADFIQTIRGIGYMIPKHKPQKTS